jgi:hypothetical protein
MIDLLTALEPDFQKIIGTRVRLLADFEPLEVNVIIPAGTVGKVRSVTFGKPGAALLDVDWHGRMLDIRRDEIPEQDIASYVPADLIEWLP